MTSPVSQRRRALVAAGSIGAIGALVVPTVMPAAAQPAPPPAPQNIAAPGATTPAAPTAPVDPAAATTTTVAPGPPKQPPGRRALSRDPEKLAADGRAPSGMINGISPALDVVPVTSEVYDGVAKERDRAASRLADANHRIDTTSEQVAALEREHAAIDGIVERGRVRLRKLTSVERNLDAAIRDVALSRFIAGSSEDLYPDPNETIAEALERSHTATMSAEAQRQLFDGRDDVRRRLASARAEQRRLTDRGDDNRSETATARREHQRAMSDAQIATEELVGAERELRSARPMTVVAGSDLPLVALDAYWRVANDIAVTRSSCGLGWWALAAIGRSESNHGRSAGGQAGPDGTLSVPVYGVRLDGTGATREIADSDKGELDLDPDFDRAVGAMQFIPGTWRRYAEDMSGDKKSDPQNIYDASLAAAKLLCTHGPGLDTPDGMRKAFLAYNRSEDYADLVLSRAQAYQQLPVPGPPST